jgi:curved DNA-binding protein CbpA
VTKSNPYAVLGLSPSAKTEEIQAQYRRLARERHPDRNREDPTATARMAEINAAYAELRDPIRRLQHQLDAISGAANVPPPPERIDGWGTIKKIVEAVGGWELLKDAIIERLVNPQVEVRIPRRKPQAHWDSSVSRYRGSGGRFAKG